MVSVYIKAISYYLPENVIENADLQSLFPDWNTQKVAKKIGINKRHVAEAHECASDLAICAANKLFKEHNISREEIDFILYCTQSPDYFLPSTSCIIQDRLGLSTGVGALDFNLGCSGFLYGLALAKGLLLSGVANNVLLITSETYSKFIHQEDRSNRTIFGDASAATIISKSGIASIGDFILGTDGKGADNLIVREGGGRFPIGSSSVTSSSNSDIEPSCLYMNGPEIFSFTSQKVPDLVKQVLEKSGLLKEDISKFIFHQANGYMLEHLRKKIEIPIEKFPLFLENVGNTVSSTIPILLYEEMFNKKEYKPNDTWLMAGFGVGYSWGGCIIKF